MAGERPPITPVTHGDVEDALNNVGWDITQDVAGKSAVFVDVDYTPPDGLESLGNLEAPYTTLAQAIAGIVPTTYGGSILVWPGSHLHAGVLNLPNNTNILGMGGRGSAWINSEIALLGTEGVMMREISQMPNFHFNVGSDSSELPEHFAAQGCQFDVGDARFIGGNDGTGNDIEIEDCLFVNSTVRITGDLAVITDCSFRNGPGDLATMRIGPSGGGGNVKSTYVRMVGCYIGPSSLVASTNNTDTHITCSGCNFERQMFFDLNGGGEVTLELDAYSYETLRASGTNLEFPGVNVIVHGVDDMYARSNTVYVDPRRTVYAPRNGSKLAPYSTLSDAMASITDATEVNRYTIKLAAGTHAGNSNIKPWVHIIGDSFAGGSTWTGTATGEMVDGKAYFQFVACPNLTGFSYQGASVDNEIIFLNCRLGAPGVAFSASGSGSLKHRFGFTDCGFYYGNGMTFGQCVANFTAGYVDCATTFTATSSQDPDPEGYVSRTEFHGTEMTTNSDILFSSAISGVKVKGEFYACENKGIVRTPATGDAADIWFEHDASSMGDLVDVHYFGGSQVGSGFHYSDTVINSSIPDLTPLDVCELTATGLVPGQYVLDVNLVWEGTLPSDRLYFGIDGDVVSPTFTSDAVQNTLESSCWSYRIPVQIGGTDAVPYDTFTAKIIARMEVGTETATITAANVMLERKDGSSRV